MNTVRLIAALVAVVVLALIAYALVALFSAHDRFTEKTYGYSFRIPEGTEVRAAGSGADIGTTTGGSFEPLAAVRVAIAQASTTYANYDDFLRQEAGTFCTSASTAGTCGEMTRQQDFSAQTGLAGSVFYFTFTATSSGATTTREAGPFYAFALSPNVPQAQYAALLVYPTHFAEESALYDRGAETAHAVADTATIDKVSY